LCIEVDYRSEVSRTEKNQQGSLSIIRAQKNNLQFAELLLLAQLSPILFLEELNIGTVKYLTAISGTLLTTRVQTSPYNPGSRQHLLGAPALTMVAEFQK
jgi:hypothetical protein